MPTLFELGFGRIKVSIYFRDHNPSHVHVTAPGAAAVFDISTLECVESKGFSQRALGKIQRFLESKQDVLQEEWNEHQKT
jgi:hypothetical protein